MLLVFAAACAPMTPPPSAPTPAPKISQTQPPASEAACKVAGGDWRPVCLLGKPACVITYKDAGKACRNPSDCSSGGCYATDGAGRPGPATGACAPTSDPCGCRAMVVNGQSTAMLCVD
jgi:hypothetical protein